MFYTHLLYNLDLAVKLASNLPKGFSTTGTEVLHTPRLTDSYLEIDIESVITR